MTLTRRGFLAGSALTLAGCAGRVYGVAEDPGTPYRVPGASRLRIAVFELQQPSLAFHTGLIIHAPEGRVIYDPAGFWHHPDAPRINDVSYGMTPELEELYLTRRSPGLRSGNWVVHLFESEVPPAVASRAVAIAEARKPLFFGACAWGLTTLLAQLPGFQDMRTALLPLGALEQLQERNDLRYSQRVID